MRFRLAPTFALWFLVACATADPSGTDMDAGDAGGQDVLPDSADDAALDAGSDAALDGGEDVGSGGDRIDDLEAALTRGNAEQRVAIFNEVLLDEGWPICDGGRCLFVTRWDDANGQVYVAGDFNEWVRDAAPATALAPGIHYAIAEAGSIAGEKYKWVDQTPDSWRPGFEAIRYEYDEFGEVGYVTAPEGAAYLMRLRDRPLPPFETLHTVWIRVPAVLSASPRTVVLSDGQNVFDRDALHGGWQFDLALTAEFDDVLAIAVASGPDRFRLFTHVSDDRGDGPQGGQADDYLGALNDEVLPNVERRLGVSLDPERTILAGSSLGGLVALYAAQSRASEYACVIAMSPSAGWGAYSGDESDTLLGRFTEQTDTAIYLDSGGGGDCADPDGDGVFEDSDDADNFCVTNQLRDHLASLGWEFDSNLFHWWESGAPHNEAAWRARVPMALESCGSAGW